MYKYFFYSRLENKNTFSITKYSDIKLLGPSIIFNNYHFFVTFSFNKTEINFNNGHYLEWELEERKNDSCLNVFFFLPFVTIFFLSLSGTVLYDRYCATL